MTDGDKIVPFPPRQTQRDVEPTHDDLARWLFTYANEIRTRPDDEADTLIALQLECERISRIDGDWVNGLIDLVEALLQNKRTGDDPKVA
jgi:hypothetical protein